MKANKDFKGMRMDLVYEPIEDVPSQVVELKRGTHMLLAYRGKQKQRLSCQLIKAIKQLYGYGKRLDTDIETKVHIEENYSIKIDNPELKLIAGRCLESADEYSLLSSIESDEKFSKFNLLIYTWDGFLAELERIPYCGLIRNF